MYKTISEQFGRPEVGIRRRSSSDPDISSYAIT
jgi:hypothetical protein